MPRELEEGAWHQEAWPGKARGLAGARLLQTESGPREGEAGWGGKDQTTGLQNCLGFEVSKDC